MDDINMARVIRRHSNIELGIIIAVKIDAVSLDETVNGAACRD